MTSAATTCRATSASSSRSIGGAKRGAMARFEGLPTDPLGLYGVNLRTAIDSTRAAIVRAGTSVPVAIVVISHRLLQLSRGRRRERNAAAKRARCSVPTPAIDTPPGQLCRMIPEISLQSWRLCPEWAGRRTPDPHNHRDCDPLAALLPARDVPAHVIHAVAVIGRVSIQST
jgi:hypothetical protein